MIFPSRITSSSFSPWNSVGKFFRRFATNDVRIGGSHTNVPGHDGKKGFGGTCFPKDINALIYFAKQKGIDLDVLKSVWETNLKVRPEKDWEKLKGRAVIKKD